ncbi:MAG: hypothetical protein JWM44_3118 [Bacilli bacterium]|nr:hypothetical protein [Bacilli bacterium]
MAILIINYDLNAPGKEYQKVIAGIESFNNFKHPQKSTWFVVTPMTHAKVYEFLKPNLDKNDTIYIEKVSAGAFGQMPTGFWDWHKANV